MCMLILLKKVRVKQFCFFKATVFVFMKLKRKRNECHVYLFNCGRDRKPGHMMRILTSLNTCGFYKSRKYEQYEVQPSCPRLRALWIIRMKPLVLDTSRPF